MRGACAARGWMLAFAEAAKATEGDDRAAFVSWRRKESWVPALAALGALGRLPEGKHALLTQNLLRRALEHALVAAVGKKVSFVLPRAGGANGGAPEPHHRTLVEGVLVVDRETGATLAAFANAQRAARAHIS